MLEVEWIGGGGGGAEGDLNFYMTNGWRSDEQAHDSSVCTGIPPHMPAVSHTQKCTLVIPKGTLPLRHAFHSFLWRKSYQLKTLPFIKKRRFGGKVRHGADKLLSY